MPHLLQLSEPARYWPRHAFHFTDMANVPNIIREGALLSRAQLDLQRIEFADTSSHGIVERTPETHPFVRLYFRPVTPMQYGAEGIKPLATIVEGRHWPVPVFFLFRSTDVCARPSTEFTNGNFATSGVARGSGYPFLAALPWKVIYGVGPYNTHNDIDNCRFHRQAEILVPDRLSLETVEHIVCRSTAERETLIDLLTHEGLTQYVNRIRIPDSRESLFTQRHTFVRSVIWSADGIHLRLKVGGGAFAYAYTVWDPRTNVVLKTNRRENHSFAADQTIKFDAGGRSAVRLEFRVDNILAFRGLVTRPSLVTG